MAELWSVFCGESGCSDRQGKPCVASSLLSAHPSSCIIQSLLICMDIVLLAMFVYTMLYKSPLIPKVLPFCERVMPALLRSISTIVNGSLGLGSLCLGILEFEEKLRKTHSVLPLHWWLFLSFHGLTWLLVSLTISLWGIYLSKAPLRLFSILGFLSGGVSCVLSFIAAIVNKEASLQLALDVLFFLGACLLLLCAYKGYMFEEDDDRIDRTGYHRLDAEATGKLDSVDDVTPLAKAGFFSTMTFSWLNSLMKTGRQKTLKDEDIPQLRAEDRAESCYLNFVDQLNKQQQMNPSSKSSILWTLLLCDWKEILLSGFFAFVKVITISAGPLLLNAFVNFFEGKGSFKYEGFMLVLLLFISKTLESLSQRQWYFRTRLVGIRVRSLLTAAIYKKQLRLSNAAKVMHSGGVIMNYVTVDAYRIGEFPYWFHQTWTTILQICLTFVVLFQAVGPAAFASLLTTILTVLCNTPLSKLQHKFQTKLMVAQDKRLKACSEALVNMKVLKLYAWETHFKNVIENLREVELKWLSAVLLQKGYNAFLFWSSPVLISAATFGACYFLRVPLTASNVFTVVATLRLVQDSIRNIPDAIAVVIQAKVAYARILKFLEAPELEITSVRQKTKAENLKCNILIRSASLSWEGNLMKPNLRNINLEVKLGEKIAICGEVGSGKSTLLASILGEVPVLQGNLQVSGTIAYVSQSAWIQTGSIRDNILFGAEMDHLRYQKSQEKSSLKKDLEMLPYGDLTEIGERGVNLSGGQKQRIQLARALYKDADIYLLDDPFSAVDAHTATSLFNEYVMGALLGKTVLLVTHQVDFLPAFDSVLLMSNGEILHAAPYQQLLSSSQEFQDLVNAHKETAGSERLAEVTSSKTCEASSNNITKILSEKKPEGLGGDQLIKQEEKEGGNMGLRPYMLYLNQNKGYLFFTIAVLSHITFIAGQLMQNTWMAANVENPNVSKSQLLIVYLLIGFISTLFLLCRSLVTVTLGLQSSISIFSQLLSSLFRAPMSFYNSTPLGRILSRVSVDLSIVDLDLPFTLILSVSVAINFYANLGVLSVVTWQILFASLLMIYLIIRLQGYYIHSVKELMRINGTTKSSMANHLAESIAGAMTIRAFEEEDRFFMKNLDLIDRNAGPYLYTCAANEWLIQRLEMLSATVLSASTFVMTLLPLGTFSSGVIGMALSYGLSLNVSLVFSVQNQCILSNYIISVERLNQYMHIPGEAPVIVKEKRPPANWPSVGKVEIQNLEIRYRPDAPLVLRGISCTFDGGHKIGIVGRTGSGKTTLIGALFRLVEPSGGRIIVDGIDVSGIGLHDLRSRLGIIPQDPTLFNVTVRYNLDPLGQHTDLEIWETLGKCHLREAIQDKEEGLDTLVSEDGSNWSMGQRQLFCLGRALLRRSKILVLDEATASIDNATDLILQRTIRTEFADCTVITVAHRIPTVMDCTMVLSMSDGELVEYDEPMKLMKTEGSLFGQLVNEYWSHQHYAELH